MDDDFLWVFISLLAIAAFLFSVRKTADYRRISSAVLLKTPMIGNLVQKIYLARFCNSMRLLINARLPLLRAIDLCRQMIGYYPIEISLKKVEADILQVRSSHQSMQQFNVYP